MATKPELRRAVANGYIKASDYNYNFEQLNNYIENGVADNAINKYEADREYGKNEWVLAGIDGQLSIFQSLVDGNKGNSLLDGNYWKQVSLGGSHTMFDTVLKDHILTYDETKGLELQGTYVYKEALAGSRYGYPDFYNRVVEEFNEATSTEEVNGITIKVHSNGHKFYDIADKDAIDSFYNSTGYAWFYGVDIENERIFLPRNKWFALKGLSDVPVVGSGIALGITNGTYTSAMCCGNSGAIGLTLMNDGTNPAGSSLYNGDANVGYGDIADGRVGVVTDPQTSGLLAKTKDAIELDDNKYLYICVGNTTNYEGVTDVVNQGMDILEQVSDKVNTDGTNLNTEGKSLFASFAMPSNRYIDLTLGASGTNYTAPANGWLVIWINGETWLAVNTIETYGPSFVSYAIPGVTGPRVTLPLQKGQMFHIDYERYPESARFYYAEGEV